MPFSLSLLQQPLPHLDDIITGTQEWQYTPLKVAMKGSKVAYMTADLDGGRAYADGVDFPNVGPKVGIYSAKAVVDFMVPSQPSVRHPSNRSKAD